MFALALMFPVYFVAAGTLAQLRDDSNAGRVVKSALVTALVFVGIPLLLALFQRIRLDSGFGLRRPRFTALLSAIVLGVSLWPLAFELYFLNEALGIKGFHLSQFEAAREIARTLRELPWPLLVTAIGIVPGICEEYFFRGMLFGALRQTLSARSTILWTAVVFGLFHVVSGNAFLPERFLTSACLGLVLGWVRWKSDSIVPSMVLHSIHNSVLLALTHWEEQLKSVGFGIQQESHLPITWIFASACAVCATAWFLAVTSASVDRNRSKSDVGEIEGGATQG
jgi:ABC-2 type transport system permease protein/sodium transport system permease protein